ncbi:MAG: PASTA domain-containing protein, partial [Oscillospiraceae bacterium]|nr:PASTA domain-containing protein [Oscillospiraceae bacterium]
EAQAGNNITLTIDARIQAIVEKYVTQAVNDNDVRHRAAAVAINPKTGEILAMATCDKDGSYSLNQPFELSPNVKETLPAAAKVLMDTDPEKDLTQEQAMQQAESNALSAMWRNKAVSDVYYPGSVFKMVTASMALEENLITSSTGFYCSGEQKVPGYGNISCHLSGGHGAQTFEEIIWHSCNPGFIQLGNMLGSRKFYEYYQAFGYSQRSGVDMPGESDDIFFSVTDGEFNSVSLATASFGQNFGITPIQMVTAASVIANGGNLVTPYVVKQITDQDGNIIKTTEPKIKRQVISAEVAARMRDILEENAISGGGKNGYVAGYRVAGKTGTTEKIGLSDVPGQKDYISSYCGFAPADDPQIAILIMCDTPKGDNYYGSMVAAPAFASIMAEVAQYLEIEPRYTAEELENVSINVDSYIGLTVKDARAKAKEKNLTVTVKGEGEKVLAQIPQTGSKIPSGGNVVLYTDTESAAQTSTVPDFVGLTEDEVYALAESSGVNVSVTGLSGADNSISTEQSIVPGSKVNPGTVVTVKFVTSGYAD